MCSKCAQFSLGKQAEEMQGIVVVVFYLLFVTSWEIIITLIFKGHQRTEMMWSVCVWGWGGI